MLGPTPSKRTDELRPYGSHVQPHSGLRVGIRVGMIQDPVIFYPFKQAAPGGRHRRLPQNGGTFCRGLHNTGCNILESVLRFYGNYHFTFP